MSDTRSMTTKFKADTSGFKKGMDEMIDKLNAYNKKLVDNQYSQRECNQTISKAKKELKELQETVAKNGKATEDEEKRMRELNRTIEEQTLQLSQLRTEQASIRNLISETTRTLTDNNDQWTVLKGTLANLASDTLKKLGSALKNTVSDVIQTGEQFTAAISKVGAISGATAEELQQLEDAARLYGSTTMYSAKEAADALQYMALAGWNTEQSIEGLPSVLNLAASSGMDLGRASDIVTDYITAFGLSVDDAARFVDIMSYAMSHSNTTTEMLGEAYKNCAATARSMGFSVEEVTAALMTMANAGVKGGEAGTTLNTLMTRLATDTKGCATALEEYGVEIYDAQGTMKSLSEILSGMVSVWDTLTQKQQANLSKAIAGTNQYAGFQTLMQGMSQAAKDAGMSFEDYTAALEECSGTASEMSAAMTDNLTGDLKAMQSAMDELKLKIFEDAEQPLRNIVQWITKNGIPALEALVKNIDKIIPVVVAATAAMVSYKAALAVESIIKGVKNGLAALRAARIADTAATEAETAAQTALNTTQAANPIGLLVGAIGGLAAGLATVAAMTNQATESTKNYNEALDELLKKQSEAEADAAAEGAEVKLLQSEYDRLRQETDLTTREKERLNTVCEQLAGKLGLTTEELRTQEGAYRDLTVEVDKYIEKLKEQAKYEYYESIIKESTKAAVQIEADLEAAEKARQAWFDGNVETYLEMVKILQDQGHSIDQLTGFVSLYALIDQLNGQLEKAHDAADRATEAYYRLGDAVPKFSSVIGSLIGDLKDGTQNTEDYTNAITDAEKKLEELARGSKAFQSQSTSLRSEMNSLANSLKQLESGEALSLNTLLDLIDKYPEYTDELIAAAGNADLQRSALEHLFEAKKQEYILSLERASSVSRASNEETAIVLDNLAKQMEAYNSMSSVMGNVALAAVVSNKIVAGLLKSQAQELRNTVSTYEREIEFVKNLKIGDFVTTSGGTSGTAKSAAADKKNTLTSPHTWNYKGETYTAEYSYTEGEYDAVRDADTNAKAYLGVLDRVKNFGKLTLGEEISNLQTILKWEKLSGDQRYEIRLRLYKAETELAKKTAEAEEAADKEAADRAKKAADEAAQALLERQNMALAAYNKLVNGRIEALEAESQAAQDNADKQIAAIDAVMKKRREESEDAKRQQELDQINAKLKYQQLDEFERLSLERRRQDILNEQTEVRYERMMEGRKAMITGTAEAIQNKNAQAIAGLQASQTQAADRVAYLQGNQTYDQRVKNNTVTQNVTVVQNGLSGDQLIKRLLKELGAI